MSSEIKSGPRRTIRGHQAQPLHILSPQVSRKASWPKGLAAEHRVEPGSRWPRTLKDAFQEQTAPYWKRGIGKSHPIGHPPWWPWLRKSTLRWHCSGCDDTLKWTKLLEDALSMASAWLWAQTRLETEFHLATPHWTINGHLTYLNALTPTHEKSFLSLHVIYLDLCFWLYVCFLVNVWFFSTRR